MKERFNSELHLLFPAIVIIFTFSAMETVHGQESKENTTSLFYGERSPDISLDNSSNIYTAWIDNTSGKDEIFFSKSTDGGTTFLNPINLSKSLETSISPSIAVYNDNIHIVWGEGGVPQYIAYSKSTDGGNTFSEPISLTTTTVGHSNPDITTGTNGELYLIWSDNQNEIVFSKSTDDGTTFSEPINISKSPYGSFLSKISIGNNNSIFTTWQEQRPIPGPDPVLSEIFFSKSTDNGLSFDTPVNLSKSIGNSGNPSVTSMSDDVYVTWQDKNSADGTIQIFFSKSTDGGNTFSEPTMISNSTGNSINPSIYNTIESIYTLWRTFTTPTDNDIFFSKSTDGGNTFSNPINVSNSVGNHSFSVKPSITSDINNNVYVVYDDRITDELKTFFSKSTDGGNTFSEPIAVVGP